MVPLNTWCQAVQLQVPSAYLQLVGLVEEPPSEEFYKNCKQKQKICKPHSPCCLFLLVSQSPCNVPLGPPSLWSSCSGWCSNCRVDYIDSTSKLECSQNLKSRMSVAYYFPVRLSNFMSHPGGRGALSLLSLIVVVLPSKFCRWFNSWVSFLHSPAPVCLLLASLGVHRRADQYIPGIIQPPISKRRHLRPTILSISMIDGHGNIKSQRAGGDRITQHSRLVTVLF